MKLKYIQPGIWEARDGSFRFEKWLEADSWFVYERSPHPEDDGFYDEPSFGMSFDTLEEAAAFAEGRSNG